MNKKNIDSYVKFSGYNSIDKQNNANYNDIPTPTQVPDPNNNRFSNPPPKLLNQEESKQDLALHRVRDIESAKLHQLITDPNYHKNPRGPTRIFVKVSTEWCGPCKMIAPKIQHLSNNPKYSDILFVQINGEKICDKLKKYINISAVPVFFTFVEGKQYQDFIVGPDMKKIVLRLDELSIMA